MIHHVSYSVSNYARSLEFYDRTLIKLGVERVMTFDNAVAGYGQNGQPFFWISRQGNPEEEIGNARGMHVAFSAPSRRCVQAWYEECLALGGTDNGAPGPRPEYDLRYYGAFITDPDGWRIEAVTFNDE